MLNYDPFNNHQRSSYEELKTYIPSWWNGILEMDANNRFAGYTLDQAADALEQFVKNWFFETMDEQSLSSYEQFLGIEPQGDLEDRRKYARAAWVGGQKMNRTKIMQLVKQYCDSDSHVFCTDRMLVIEIHELQGDPSAYIGKLQSLVSNSTVPAHIRILYRGNIKDVFVIPDFLYNNIRIDRMEIKGKLKVYSENIESALLIQMDSERVKESIPDVSMEVRRNLWYLDGKYMLDGSKLLNASIRWEEDI